MTITYRIPWDDLPNVKVAVLHRITYGYSDTPQARHECRLKEHHIRKWCATNCQAAYYFHPGYTREKFIEFEDDEDSILFKLTWS